MTTEVTEIDYAEMGLCEPPFYRGVGGASDWCDRLMPDGNACDDTPQYTVWWLMLPGDLGQQSISQACETHARDVDRNLVRTIKTAERQNP